MSNEEGNLLLLQWLYESLPETPIALSHRKMLIDQTLEYLRRDNDFLTEDSDKDTEVTSETPDDKWKLDSDFRPNSEASGE